MPQIFPSWMTSPFVMYGVPALLVLILVKLLVTRNWRGLRRYVGVMLVVALVGYTGFTAYMKYIFADFQWQMPPATVMVQAATPMPFEDRIEAIGTTQANESTALTSNVTETVKAINFEEGQYVTAGTVIAELQDDEQLASLTEAEQAYARTAQLVRSNALSIARRDADKAKLDIARAQISARRIVAPFDGILGLRSISVGDIVNPGTVITTLDDVDPIKLEFSVPEAYLAVLSPGLTIKARSDAYPGIFFTGEIKAIDPRIDPVTRTLKVKAHIPNPDGKLRAGMLMALDIVKNNREALAVSEEALVSQGSQKMVMVVGTPDKDGLVKVDARPVVLGTRMPGYVEITSGLTAGEKVVVEGVIKAHPGAMLKVEGEKTITQTVDRALDNAVTGKQDELKSIGIGSDGAAANAKDTPAPALTPEAAAPNSNAPTTPHPDQAGEKAAE